MNKVKRWMRRLASPDGLVAAGPGDVGAGGLRDHGHGGSGRVRQPDQRLPDPDAVRHRPRDLRRARGHRRRPRPRLQRPGLRRVPSEPGERRHQPGHRAAGRHARFLQRRLHQPPGGIADQRPRDQRRDPGASHHHPEPGRHPVLAQHPGRRLRRVDRRRHLHQHPGGSAVRPEGHHHPGAGPRGSRDHAHRPLRLEEPAGQPALLRRRRLRERDGDHQPAAAHGEHLDGQLRRGVRHRPRSGRGGDRGQPLRP